MKTVFHYTRDEQCSHKSLHPLLIRNADMDWSASASGLLFNTNGQLSSTMLLSLLLRRIGGENMMKKSSWAEMRQADHSPITTMSKTDSA